MITHPLFRLPRFALLICWWLLASCATDQPAPRQAKSLLWSVRSPTNTVYLMGSVHVLPKRAYPLKPALIRAFHDSQRVVFEIPLSDHNQEAAARDAFQSGVYPPGQTLSQHLSQDTLALLRQMLPSFGVSLDKLETLRPWMVSDLIMNSYLEKLGYHGDLGLDMYFHRAAQKAGKPVSGLEKVRDQTQLFTRMTDAQADAYLRDTLLSLPSTGEWFRQTVRAWERGDSQMIDSTINQSRQSGDEKFYHSVFDARNNAWMPAIREMIGQRENYLVIVGAGHLVGRQGVVEQLRQAGYTVEQL